MAQTLFCTQSDVERIFAKHGVRSFGDHDQDGALDTGVVAGVIRRASGEIEFRTKIWGAEALASSELVTEWAAVLAVFYLCQLRGNSPPASLAEDAQRIFEDLKLAAEGQAIPGAGEPIGAGVPKFSNPTICRGAGVRQITMDRVPGAHIAQYLQQERGSWNYWPSW